MPSAHFRRIATEEGFSIPELGQATLRYVETHNDEPGLQDRRRAGARSGSANKWVQQLGDIDKIRIADMDAANIDAAVIMVSSPGVQIFDPIEGRELASLVNDRAAAAMRAHPDRLYPLAALAAQDPESAAQELERAVKTLGLKGCIINSSTKGGYLDEQKFWPILEAAQALDVPIYIHPREPSPAMIGPYLPYQLIGAIWGYAAETGLHAVRMIIGGVFDQFPKLKIVLGHCGEALPFFMDRLDGRHAVEGALRPTLKRRPSDYLRDNFFITSSGMNWEPAVRLCLDVLGPDKVLFAADYPFEDAVDAVKRANSFKMSENERELFYCRNAERVFKL